MTRNFMDRFIDTIEWTAALFVGIVAADVFISVLLRYLFNVSIPDSYDFGRLLLAILIFWGIGATSYRGTHITVDLLYANVVANGANDTLTAKDVEQCTQRISTSKALVVQLETAPESVRAGG